MLKLLEQYLINHCAPTLCGVKIANLISVPLKDIELIDIQSVNKLINKHNMHLYLLRKNSKSMLLYIFNISDLTKRLKKNNVKDFLDKYYYPLNSVFDILEHLKFRINSNKEFPHEIGIFLDYPLSDIESYILNRGKNFIFVGTWKVYNDIEFALKRFNSFKLCNLYCKYYFDIGLNIEDIINKYKGEKNEEISYSLLEWNR
ncbi:DUF3793 family protein [Miniphocaeibacter massiliensis]|uniref:DUF3793 family protein n=1 Tax=Miniphocaeibacter massiliensis TaxID=2041841 RepID=UPI000C077AF1|nr:DUF3793 family protein [Miniphocaeibacter massiliensis]